MLIVNKLINQKIVDVSGKNNVIVLLNNRKILYCEENKVKVMPEMQINITDSSSFDSVFTGSFAFALMHDIKIDEAIKFANTSAAISLTKVGEEPAIPTLDEVFDNSGLRDEFKSYKPQETAPEAPVETAEAPQEAPQETAEATPSAFEQKPVETSETQEAPVETPPQEEVKAEEVAQPQETQEPQHEETNIFG